MGRLVFMVSLCFIVLSCSSNDEVQINSINNNWQKNKTQDFQFEINDAGIPKNIIFVVRNNNDYPYSNLFLMAGLYQEGKLIGKIDTLNYRLANPDGTWIGSGFGDTKELAFEYKMKYQFPKNGRYTLKVKHGMRRDTLHGIEDLGIEIQSIK
ncbi:gliding motility lipoprotein GldH [Riemerella columbina]|uniref:gliding motility lipoprotein GldH n=1 Tax=Riemerella columbina TaxID=103810 RepID=UPI0003A6E67F|nr:gliding motility lipoprotein GldH [Riemerella columbina]